MSVSSDSSQSTKLNTLSDGLLINMEIKVTQVTVVEKTFSITGTTNVPTLPKAPQENTALLKPPVAGPPATCFPKASSEPASQESWNRGYCR